MKHLIKILLSILLITPVFVFASHGEEIIPPLPASYLFHLYYDNDQLFADRDFEFKYDVAPEEYTPETPTTPFPFRGEIINFLNQIAAEFEFDPRKGNPDFLGGKIKVNAPYIPDGQKAIFYDSQGRTLLTIFVSESSFCNDDGVCNFDKGENEKTCPNDCTGVTPAPSPVTDGGESLSGTSIILSVLVLALIGTGGWYTFRRWRKVKHVQEDQFTPSLNKDITPGRSTFDDKQGSQ